jgi:hypothetical protein
MSFIVVNNGSFGDPTRKVTVTQMDFPEFVSFVVQTLSESGIQPDLTGYMTSEFMTLVEQRHLLNKVSDNLDFAKTIRKLTYLKQIGFSEASIKIQWMPTTPTDADDLCIPIHSIPNIRCHLYAMIPRKYNCFMTIHSILGKVPDSAINRVIAQYFYRTESERDGFNFHTMIRPEELQVLQEIDSLATIEDVIAY